MILAKGCNLIRIKYTEDCGKLIKKEYYEPLIRDLMNRSKGFFPNKPIEWFGEKQHNNEPDFRDYMGKIYDAKCILSKDQGSKLGRKVNKDANGFFYDIQKELMEFGEMKKDNALIIEKTKFYKLVKDGVKKCAPNENIIMFIPFPIFPETEGSFFSEIRCGCAHGVYSKLKENGIIGEREFYYIYPVEDGLKYIIREPETGKKEFIPMPEYQEYLSFERMDVN